MMDSIHPTKKTVTLRIKSLIAIGDAVAAERILSSLSDDNSSASVSPQWKKLRTFLPILQYHANRSDPVAILRLFRKMRESNGVFFDADTYAVILSSLARMGCFRSGNTTRHPQADFISSNAAAGLGFSASCGPDLFNEIVAEMAEDLLELTEESAAVLSRGMREGFYNSMKTYIDPNDDKESCYFDRDVKKFVEFRPFCDAENGVYVDRVSINETTAVCAKTGVKLRLFSLSEPQRRQVHDTLLEMSAVQHEEFGEKLKGKRKKSDSQGEINALEELSRFSTWLKDREGEPFTAFVDGPNVAYYGHGKVHYSQVQLVVDELEKMGENVLVVMPIKYAMPKFRIANLNMMQELSEREIDIMNSLRQAGKMYIVPIACLDDYYWMISSVANQTSSSKVIRVSAGDNTGRFPGLRPMLVTNDQMRDHRLSLLEPRLFRRWKSCHIVNYDIKPYQNDEWEERTVEFKPADFFSREIQSKKDPRREGTLVWHFPVSEWPEPDRLCIYIVN